MKQGEDTAAGKEWRCRTHASTYALVTVGVLMYRKAQYMLMVVALTMSMLLVGIGPAQANESENNCLFGIFFCFDDGSSDPQPVSTDWFNAFMGWVNSRFNQ